MPLVLKVTHVGISIVFSVLGPASIERFNSDWKEIVGTSILCFLNLHVVGFQGVLPVCWEVGFSSSSFANRAGSVS